jgi:hypothetical protein
VYEHRESDALERACEVLGVRVWKEGGEGKRSEGELRREIALRRMFGVRAIEGAAVVRRKGTEVYMFPHDIWHVIGEYLETLSILKLEKTCRAMYLKYNKKCTDCEQGTLSLGSKCTNFWRR